MTALFLCFLVILMVLSFTIGMIGRLLMIVLWFLLGFTSFFIPRRFRLSFYWLLGLWLWRILILFWNLR